MTTRKVLIATLGHVDHGKTSLLDKIRKSAVTVGEAGGITQAIGVSIIPIETIKKICGKLLDVFQNKLTIPGFLAIDTPGHAAFTSLRKRGGSLADIAILVVDINEGFKPQTIESIEILRSHKVPFVIAANKIDLIHHWKYDPSKFLLENIAEFDWDLQGQFEQKMYALIGKFNELGLQAERFDRVSDYTHQLAIVPLSALTGQGIPELLMVLTGLSQKYMEQKLVINEQGDAKGTILEVKEEKGLGVTLNTIIYNGHLRAGDTIIIGGLEGPIVTKIRTLLEPAELSDMRDKKSTFTNVKEVNAATGVKIVAPGLEKAVAGMPVRGCSGKPEQIEQYKQEVQSEVGEIITSDESEHGAMLKADTIGGLEALRTLLKDKNLPIAYASIGEITRRDLSKLEALKEKDEFTGVLLGFNLKLAPDLEDQVKTKKLKVFLNDVIYRTIDQYEEYIESLKREVELRELATIVRPCKFFLLKGLTFRQNNPSISGVEIEIGKLRSQDPIMDKQGRHLTKVKSMKDGEDSVNTAEQGRQLALAMDNITIGRQVEEGDYLYTDIPEEDFRKLKELKKHLTKMELEVLKEIAEIKRKDNPVWGAS